jgi:NAD(P)-dependent dehydrogenase (short-subunit alcohol dehydrogenase family)
VMTSQKPAGGVIVNVSSMAAKDPLPGFLAYAAAKAGLNLFGLALAREGAPYDIRVHTVAPGSVETGMFRALVDEQTWPREKTLDPADVARVIAACADGTLRHASGGVIYLNRNP